MIRLATGMLSHGQCCNVIKYLYIPGNNSRLCLVLIFTRFVADGEKSFIINRFDWCERV